MNSASLPSYLLSSNASSLLSSSNAPSLSSNSTHAASNNASNSTSSNANASSSTLTSHSTNSNLNTSSNATLSSFHQASLSQLQVSRQSSQPHQRSRTAMFLIRNHSSNSTAPILLTQFDPNAPPLSLSKLPTLPHLDTKLSSSMSSFTSSSSSVTSSNSSLSSSSPTSSFSSSLSSSSSSFSSSSFSTTTTTSSSSTPSWTILDLGGLQMRSLSSSLSHFSFLTMLYLNHNQFHELPTCITQLSNLIFLDFSGNRLTFLPTCLFRLIHLQYLYLFDNLLHDIPYILGSLPSLEQVGLEGNPLPDEMLILLQKEGTTALVAYLRDHAPVGPPPPERNWITIDAPPLPPSTHAELCSVFCYNILSEKYATQKQYGYTPSWALAWSYRGDAILQEILLYSSDIVCLQEIEYQQYQSYFKPQLKELGDYDSVYWMKTRARTMNELERQSVDGCAIFFRSYKYELLEHWNLEFNQYALHTSHLKKTEDVYTRFMTKDNVAVLALLQNKETLGHVFIANSHIHWDPLYSDVKLIQVKLLLERIEQVLETYPVTYQRSAQELPIFICGDFNSTPSSGVYEFLNHGSLEKHHPDFLSFQYTPYTEMGMRHSLPLKSAYDQGPTPLPFTNYTAKFSGMIDYIWYTHPLVCVLGLLGGVDPEYCENTVGFPNVHFSSDHIPLLVEFRITRKTILSSTSTRSSSSSSSSSSSNSSSSSSSSRSSPLTWNTSDG